MRSRTLLLPVSVAVLVAPAVATAAPEDSDTAARPPPDTGLTETGVDPTVGNGCRCDSGRSGPAIPAILGLALLARRRRR